MLWEKVFNSRQREKQVQMGSGPGIYKEQLRRPTGQQRVNKAGSGRSEVRDIMGV